MEKILTLYFINHTLITYLIDSILIYKVVDNIFIYSYRILITNFAIYRLKSY